MREPRKDEYRIPGADYVDYDMAKADPANGAKPTFQPVVEPKPEPKK